MKINVYYLSGKIDSFDTESKFCGANAISPKGDNVTLETILRFDLMSEEGLLLEFLWYNLIFDELTAYIYDDEIDRKLPAAGREAACFVRLISRDELDDVAAIYVDDTLMFWRQGDELINGIRFSNQEFLCFSNDKTASNNRKAIELFNYLQAAYPYKHNDEIARMIGYTEKSIAQVLELECAQINHEIKSEDLHSSESNSSHTEDDEEEEVEDYCGFEKDANALLYGTDYTPHGPSDHNVVKQIQPLS